MLLNVLKVPYKRKVIKRFAEKGREMETVACFDLPAVT